MRFQCGWDKSLTVFGSKNKGTKTGIKNDVLLLNDYLL